jgi:hypothetical protein
MGITTLKSKSSNKPLSKKPTNKKDTHHHSPTLETIEMVEKSIIKIGYYRSKTHLYNSLPRKVQYPTLLKILKYLEDSNKITFNKDNSITWIFNDSGKLKKLVQKSTVLR